MGQVSSLRLSVFLIMAMAAGSAGCKFDKIHYSPAVYRVTIDRLDVWDSSPEHRIVAEIKRGGLVQIVGVSTQNQNWAFIRYYSYPGIIPNGWVERKNLERVTIDETVFSPHIEMRKVLTLRGGQGMWFEDRGKYYLPGMRFLVVYQDKEKITYQLPNDNYTRAFPVPKSKLNQLKPTRTFKHEYPDATHTTLFFNDPNFRNFSSLRIETSNWDTTRNAPEDSRQPMPSLFWKVFHTVTLNYPAVLVILFINFIIYTFIYRKNKAILFIIFFSIVVLFHYRNYHGVLKAIQEGNMFVDHGPFSFTTVLYIPSIFLLAGLCAYGAFLVFIHLKTLQTEIVMEESNDISKKPNKEPSPEPFVPEVISLDSVKGNIEEIFKRAGDDKILIQHLIDRFADRIRLKADIKTQELILTYAKQRTEAYKTMIDFQQAQQRYRDIQTQLNLQKIEQDIALQKAKTESELEVKRKKSEIVKLDAQIAESELKIQQVTLELQTLKKREEKPELSLEEKIKKEKDKKEFEKAKIDIESDLAALERQKITENLEWWVLWKIKKRKELEAQNLAPEDVDRMIGEIEERLHEKGIL